MPKVRKLEAGSNACIREQEYYDILKLHLQKAIKTAELDIARLKIDLEEARQVRINNEQYEVLARELYQTFKDFPVGLWALTVHFGSIHLSILFHLICNQQ